MLVIVSNIGKNFVLEEFRQYAASLNIDIKEILVEAYNSIGKVERYYGLLRRAYEILTNELPTTSKDVLLQIVVKVINDSAGLDGIVLILLVFSIYLRLTKDLPLSPSIIARITAIYKVIKEVRCIYVERQVRDTLIIRNRLNTYRVYELLL